MLKVETFFIKISTLMKIFITFYLLNKTMRQLQYQKEFRNSFEKYIRSFLPSFSIDYVEKLDLYSNKNAKYLFYRFNDYIKMSGEQPQTIKHTLKVKNEIGLEKIEKTDRQFLVEKIIHSVEFKNQYENSIEKRNCGGQLQILRRVYQYLYSEILGTFYEYVHSLDP